MSSATRTAFWLLPIGLLWLPCPDALALNPALDVSQYAHRAWRIRDGFAKGELHAIAQTQDGFLWLGTDFGLMRFDGVRITPWQPPQGEALPDSLIGDPLGTQRQRSRDFSQGLIWPAIQKDRAEQLLR